MSAKTKIQNFKGLFEELLDVTSEVFNKKNVIISKLIDMIKSMTFRNSVEVEEEVSAPSSSKY